MKKNIWLVYDGIAHSVFAGQVIAPALQLCKKNPDTHITIITFEKSTPSQALIDKYSSMHPHLSIKIMRKLPFLGMLSLLPALYQLRRFLKSPAHPELVEGYELKARGPLAGWLALRAYSSNNPSSRRRQGYDGQALSASSDYVTVQARGLLAEEYWYRYGKEKNLLKRIFHVWRHRELEAIESEVYGSKIKIEAVTPAMKKYLIKAFNADSKIIYIAQDDIPSIFEPAKVAQWKHTVRNDLNISESAHVYCFIGSVKSWQKPEMVIEYFMQQLKKDPEAVLLILTQDIEQFTQKLINFKVPLSHTRILSVDHEDIYRYLSAANTGLIFRDEHVLSLVARPVKAMEYQSVGLEIVHNGTVDWLNHLVPQIEDVSQADQS